MATIRKTFSLDAPVAQKLKATAEEEDRTESAIVNRLLRKAMLSTVEHPAKRSASISKKKGAVKA